MNATDGVLNGISNTAARNSVVLPFAPVPGSSIGELSVVFDIVLGYTPSDTPAGPGPSIFALNGAVHGASYQPVAAAGSWVSIFGNNLGPDTRTWNANDIVNGKLPTALDGVAVSVNDQPAAVYYISPSQLNVEIPSSVSGTAQVKVTNASGSASTSLNVQTAQPGFFLFPQGYVAAVRSDGAYIGPANLIDGVTTIPAKPGDDILLFGTGFGPTNPPAAFGEVVLTPAPLASPVKVHIDTVDAAVGFAGLTGAGLYQVNITVPNLPDGDHAVTAQAGGVWTQSFAKLRIQS